MSYSKPEPITQPIVGMPAPQDQGPPGGPSYIGGTGQQIYNPQQYQQQPQQPLQQQQQQPQQQVLVTGVLTAESFRKKNI